MPQKPNAGSPQDRLGAADYPYLDHDGPIAFAHRGGASAAPENTMPAFQRAVDLGYRYLETDVHATADDILVAFHDDKLDRVTDRAGAIRDLPWSEVSKARVDGREPIPLLADLFTAFPEARINIDAKADSSVEPLVKAIMDHKALDRVCVGSFSDSRLSTMRDRLGPQLCTSFGPAGILGLTTAARGLPSRIPPGACAQVPPDFNGVDVVTEDFVDHCHSLGLAVHVWTIDEPDDMNQLLDLEVDGIMTDEPQVLKTVFQARGIW